MSDTEQFPMRHIWKSFTAPGAKKWDVRCQRPGCKAKKYGKGYGKPPDRSCRAKAVVGRARQ